ncbi:MAG: hypothetical protein MUE41_12140, partial [Gemmatimonadaceae bacterium]|nr:hypothetical protein [Gemmatimonadaceae bacterium]
MLQVVLGAARWRDGSLVVGDRGAFALKWFRPDGKLRQAFGREGAGPGEVRYLKDLLRCGDTLFVEDIDNGHRISAFAADARFVRHFTFA